MAKKEIRTMTKIIKDRITGKSITINYSTSTAMAILCHGSVYLMKTIHPADRSMCAVAYSKGDLPAFGSFFDE